MIPASLAEAVPPMLQDVARRSREVASDDDVRAMMPLIEAAMEEFSRLRPPSQLAREYSEVVWECDGERPDLSQAIAEALARLPARQRTAVVLLYYEGLSQAEAAQVMGCSVGAVKSNCSRGLDRLRGLLEGQVS